MPKSQEQEERDSTNRKYCAQKSSLARYDFLTFDRMCLIKRDTMFEKNLPWSRGNMSAACKISQFLHYRKIQQQNVICIRVLQQLMMPLLGLRSRPKDVIIRTLEKLDIYSNFRNSKSAQNFLQLAHNNAKSSGFQPLILSLADRWRKP